MERKMKPIQIDNLGKKIVDALAAQNKGKSEKHLPKYREQALDGVFSALCDGALTGYFSINLSHETYLTLPKSVWIGKNRPNILFYDEEDDDFNLYLRLSTAKLFLKDEFNLFEKWILNPKKTDIKTLKIPHLMSFFDDLIEVYQEKRDIEPLQSRWLELSAYLRRSKNIPLVVYFNEEQAFKYLLSEGQLSIIQAHGNAREFSSEFWYEIIKLLPIFAIGVAQERTVDDIYKKLKEYRYLNDEKKLIQKSDVQSIIARIWEEGEFHEKYDLFQKSLKKYKIVDKITPEG
jgi:hypothetical protein